MRPIRTVFALAAAAALATAVASAGPADVVRVTIVHTNDLHGHVENAAAIAAVARDARARNPNTLFLDAGDAVTGTPMSSVFQGEPVFEIMSAMGYDAGLVGNHEFDNGWRQIAKYREIAAHPLLCANASDPEGRPFGDEPFRVFDVGGVRIGVLGLVTQDLAGLTTKANWAGCSVEPPLEAARRLVPEVRKRADVVVLLTHVGVEVDAAIAGAVPGIDLVVGGHSHTELKEPILVSSGGSKVPVAQAFRYGERAGILEFEYERSSRSVRNVTGRLVRIDAASMPNAPDVKALVAKWDRRTNEAAQVDLVIGRTPTRLTKERLRDAFEAIYAELLGADFGFQNLGGVRDDIAAGEIRVGSVWNALPFENTLVTVRLPGARLPAFLKKRLGRKLDEERSYAIATNSFVADQQRRYFGVEDSGLSMRDAVVKWVKEHGGLGTGGAPDGRGAGDGEK